ncbi:MULTISPECIES: peroxiredoxin [unclassified Bradyrhizobium]|uniref:peroxiredoxin n=1 Tax=unclassified Bradyrhizobium TaxID=2631580 RepID=UPI001FF9F86D|nr:MULTISPECIES: peroxiredoxin [unclassified Bradyrhizobium]MCK1344485.1 peroxiredoxin [Bradyrhizobium sp. CW11]MCK1591067.1 peroxiredoxin [Bradyrhizobium sp. 169]MCK1658634.1 peroxiredoxin [Bradyrhizobium sp. 151]UPK27674.1 peroxiredoxin [Bradyrhizobium sp. 195]
MDTHAGPLDVRSSRLEQLEGDFAALAPQLAQGPEKQAISTLHGMVQELWRAVGASGPAQARPGPNIEDIVELHQHAPAMEGDAVSTPLEIGQVAPEFALPDANGRTVRLSDFRGRPVVLAFYPLDWSPGCSRQLDLYQQEIEEFQRRGVELVGISVDSLYSHGAWAAVRGLKFPLLADFNPKGEVAKRYNVWRDKDGFSERALYVIDDTGVIRYVHVSPKLQHVPDIYELLEVLNGLNTRKAA